MEYAQHFILGLADFQPLRVDDILPLTVTEACGVSNFRDGHKHPMQYLVENQNGFCLSGTAGKPSDEWKWKFLMEVLNEIIPCLEMGIADRLRDRTFRVVELPRFYTATSRCFRPEVSKSHYESGLYRVHEFNKVEFFTCLLLFTCACVAVHF